MEINQKNFIPNPDEKNREPDMYIGKGKRRRPIYIDFIGVEKDGTLVPGIDNSPEKVMERTDKFAACFGLVRKKEHQ